MSLSQETLDLVAKGLDLVIDEVRGKYLWCVKLPKPYEEGQWSLPDLAAACKAKLRECGARYSVLTFPNGQTNVDVRWGVGIIRKPANIDRNDGNDDLALIEAFAKAVKAGEL